jgi:hypothetical protein
VIGDPAQADAALIPPAAGLDDIALVPAGHLTTLRRTAHRDNLLDFLLAYVPQQLRRRAGWNAARGAARRAGRPLMRPGASTSRCAMTVRQAGFLFQL